MDRKTLTKADYVKRINVIEEYISSHLDEEMDLKKLAEMSNFSVFHFHRIFKEIHHETLAVYVTRSRVERAAYLLRYTNMPIEMIAFNVGFEFSSSLSKAFKQFYSISPATYRSNRDYFIISRKRMKLIPDILPPKLVTLENKDVIYFRLTGNYNILNCPEIWANLRDFAVKQDALGDDAELIAIYHDDISVTQPDKLRSDICLSVNKPVTAQGKIGVKQIPGGKYAVFHYDGPFTSVSSIYDAIFVQWLPESGYEIRDLPLFEKYLGNPIKNYTGTLKTEAYLPIQLK
jgi:AraC family transcriptional regulator